MLLIQKIVVVGITLASCGALAQQSPTARAEARGRALATAKYCEEQGLKIPLTDSDFQIVSSGLKSFENNESELVRLPKSLNSNAVFLVTKFSQHRVFVEFDISNPKEKDMLENFRNLRGENQAPFRHVSLVVSSDSCNALIKDNATPVLAQPAGVIN